MSEQIKVSVIIPVYNAAEYLAQCLDSVIGQTLREIEIICVNDGSTDNSLQILNDYAKRDSRITVITQKNQYAGVARNNGMQSAKGEYLSFLDADDFFESSMLEKLYDKAVAEKADVSFCDAKIYDNGQISDAQIIYPQNFSSDILSCDNPQFASVIFQSFIGMPWNKMFKASFIKEQGLYFSSTLHHNDSAFTMGALVLAHKIAYVPEHLIYWRWVRSSLSHMPRISDSVCRSVQDIYKFISKSKNYPQVERSFINFIIEHSCRFYNYSQAEEIKVLAVANIKALNREFEITKYPDEYFYQKDNLRQFKKLARWNLLPNSF